MLEFTEEPVAPALPCDADPAVSTARLWGRPAPLGVGVVGAGYWGPRLIRNINACPEARVTGVCDLDAARLESVQGLDRDAGRHQSFDELLARPDVDAVAIATPVHTHYALAKKALQSGRSVIVEKPLASSIAQAEELVELAEARGLTLLVDHTFLYHPAVQKMRELVRGGSLGELLYYDSVRVNLGLFQPDVNVLWDLAPHDLSILTWLRPGLPETVTAVGASHWPKGSENIAYLTLRYSDNFLAHVHVSWLAPVKLRQTTLTGDRQMVVYDDNLVTEKIRVFDRGIDTERTADVHEQLVQYRLGDMYSPHIPQTEALANEVADFVECVGTGAHPLSDGETGLLVVRLLEYAQESIAEGGVPVPVL